MRLDSPPAGVGTSVADASLMTHKHRLASLAAAAGVSFFGIDASADMPLTLDVDYAQALDGEANKDGFGGGLRFGPRLDAKLLILAAELGFDVHSFPGDIGPTVYRGVVGSRFGIGWPIRPSLAAHIGVGHANWSTLSDVTHLTADLGLSLDLVVVPRFEAGVHGVYNVLFSDGSRSAFEFLTLGGHLTFAL
jgi:hypothetical protein